MGNTMKIKRIGLNEVDVQMAMGQLRAIRNSLRRVQDDYVGSPPTGHGLSPTARHVLVEIEQALPQLERQEAQP